MCDVGRLAAEGNPRPFPFASERVPMVALAPDRDARAEQFVVVPAATRNGGVPAIGWSRVAMVLRSLQGERRAVVLVELVAGGQIIIDWARRSYWWTSQPAAFPVDPRVARIRLARGDGAEVPFVQEQPGKLDVLMWYIGRAAFPTESAWWLVEGERYRLAQWPNFTELMHDPEDVRMAALLASIPMTAAELAIAAGVALENARALVNALDLMDLLVVVPGAVAPAVAAAPTVEDEQQPEARGGLFARLRARMGALPR